MYCVPHTTKSRFAPKKVIKPQFSKTKAESSFSIMAKNLFWKGKFSYYDGKYKYIGTYIGENPVK